MSVLKGAERVASTPTIDATTPTTFLSGSVIFSNGTTLAEDNTNFFYNSITHGLTVVGQTYIGPAGSPPSSIGTTFNTYTTDLNTNVVLNSFQASGSVNTSGNVQALQFNVTDIGTNSVSTLTGINGLAVKSATGGNVTTLNGIASSSRLSGGATATNMAGFSSQNRVLVGSTATQSNTFTALANTVTGTIGTACAYRAAGMKVTNVTTGLGFASDGVNDLNYNLGLTGFGQTTPTARVDASASTTAIASIRIRPGTAPTTPNDGDIWYDGTNLKMQIAGAVKTFTLV